MTKKRFQRDERGSIAIPFALVAFTITIAAGGAVDYSRAAAAKQELQAVVDALALKAAVAEEAGRGEIASRVARFRDANPQDGIDVRFEGNEIIVTGSRTVRPAFLGLVGVDALTVGATAVAFRPSAAATAKPARRAVCVLALNRTLRRAVDFGGNTTFDAPDCIVHANSDHAEALTVRGSATARAKRLCATGGVSGVAASMSCQRPRMHDPFLGKVAEPSRDRPCATVTSVGSNEDVDLQPGLYCETLHIQGTARLAPGDYVLMRGLQINSQADVTGTGVTFHIVDPPSLPAAQDTPFVINGGSRLHLTATPGTGMLIVQHGLGYSGFDMRVNGNSTTQLIGSVYVPRMALQVNGTGTFGELSHHTPLVADTVSFSGTSRVSARLDAFPKGHAPASVEDPDAAPSGSGDGAPAEALVVRLVR